MFTAPDDFQNVSVSLTFTSDNLSSRLLCQDISVLTDPLVENPETFTVGLNTSDSSVLIVGNSATVNIMDSSSELITRFLYVF